MCRGCYKAYGEPKIVTAATRAAARAIERIYEYDLAGSAAHVVVDDWNLEDDDVAFCLEIVHRSEAGDPSEPMGAEERAAVRVALELLLAMTVEERAAAMALREGWIGEGAACQMDA